MLNNILFLMRQFIRKLQNHGRSRHLIIPPVCLRALGNAKKGDKLSLSMHGKKVVITKVNRV